MNRLLLRTALLAASAGTVVMLVVFGVLEWRDISANATNLAAQQARSVADVVADNVDADQVRSAVERSAAGAGGELAVHLGARSTIGTSHASVGDVSYVLRHRVELLAGAPGGQVLLHPVSTPGGTVAVVEVYLPTADVLGPWLTRLLVMLAGALLAGTVAVVVARRRVRSLVTAVRTITSAAPSIGHGRNGIAVPASGATEITELIGVLNQISRRVDQLILSEREFVADLSHRLRTPLTALRLDSESIGDGPVAHRVRQAVRALEHDVDDLIRTAERATETDIASCQVAKVVGDRMAFWSALAEHQGRPCTFDGGHDETPVELSEKDVGAVVDALVGNVFQHTPPGTPFAASVVRYAGWVTLVVEDGGPGIPNTETALRRGASSRGSTGLGLDIARHAVEANGGTIHIDRGRLGGARILLRFAEAGAYHRSAAPRAWRLWSRSTDHGLDSSD